MNLLGLSLFAGMFVIATEGFRYVAGLYVRFAYPNGNARAQGFLDVLETLRMGLLLWSCSVLLASIGLGF